MKDVIIIGAGPAGLTAGYECVMKGFHPLIFEKSNKVGGISRTETYNGYFFDIGGHRFFTKSNKIQKLWEDVLDDDFITVPRISRIYYNGRFYDYPLQFMNVLKNLGLKECFLIVLSYIKSKCSRKDIEDSFDKWVSNQFGNRLYQTFFKTYTEKVWGIPCNQISSDWASQRIQGLSLRSAIMNAFIDNKKVKTLIDKFYYPVKGPGMMWERFHHIIENKGGTVLFNAKVIKLEHDNKEIKNLTYFNNNKREQMPVKQIISSEAISSLVLMLSPTPPEKVVSAAKCLAYRSLIVVVLMIDKKNLFPDQWIYIHSPDVKVGRIQNYANWSVAMLPDQEKTCIAMEYFCSEGDETWLSSDNTLIKQASQELSLLGLADLNDIIDHCVVRQPKAYPVYDKNYSKNLSIIKAYIDKFTNLQTIGRNGMHRYNNQDHSMLAGIMAIQNIFDDSKNNIWTINEEEDYLE
ncbi:Amine oxidase domain protein, partial [Candidatus Magnetomorum sp. HK-1]